MSEPLKNSALLGEAFRVELEDIVKGAVREALNGNWKQGKKPLETANPYLTVEEAAKFSSLGKATIRLYIDKRELKAYKVGSRIVINSSSLSR